MVPRRPLHRHALTLLEVILVLALLVVLAAVVWPEMAPVLASLELRKSAERIRVQWERSRVEALSTGRTVLFRYEPDSNRYCLDPRPEPQFLPGDGTAPNQTADPGVQDADTQSREDVLPERISFVRSEISNNATDSLGIAAEPANQGNWSDPVVFYPDGTTSDATLVLKNERNQCVDVSVRGLTGVVTVGDVYSGTEAAP